MEIVGNIKKDIALCYNRYFGVNRLILRWKTSYKNKNPLK